jgi:hypothetical protein
MKAQATSTTTKAVHLRLPSWEILRLAELFNGGDDEYWKIPGSNIVYTNGVNFVLIALQCRHILEEIIKAQETEDVKVCLEDDFQRWIYLFNEGELRLFNEAEEQVLTIEVPRQVMTEDLLPLTEFWLFDGRLVLPREVM